MRSEAANSLLTLAHATYQYPAPRFDQYIDDNGVSHATLSKMLRRNLMRLAAGIIAGQYPTLRNVMAEEPVQYDDEFEAEYLQDEANERQPCEFDSVPALVAWWSDNEDSRYENN